MGIRPVRCKCTAEGTGPVRTHGSRGHPRKSRLESCTCTHAENTAAWALLEIRGREWGETHVTGISKCKCLWGKKKNMKSEGHSQQLCWSLVSSAVKVSSAKQVIDYELCSLPGSG